MKFLQLVNEKIMKHAIGSSYTYVKFANNKSFKTWYSELGPDKKNKVDELKNSDLNLIIMTVSSLLPNEKQEYKIAQETMPGRYTNEIDVPAKVMELTEYNVQNPPPHPKSWYRVDKSDQKPTVLGHALTGEADIKKQTRMADVNGKDTETDTKLPEKNKKLGTPKKGKSKVHKSVKKFVKESVFDDEGEDDEFILPGADRYRVAGTPKGRSGDSFDPEDEDSGVFDDTDGSHTMTAISQVKHEVFGHDNPSQGEVSRKITTIMRKLREKGITDDFIMYDEIPSDLQPSFRFDYGTDEIPLNPIVLHILMNDAGEADKEDDGMVGSLEDEPLSDDEIFGDDVPFKESTETSDIMKMYLEGLQN